MLKNVMILRITTFRWGSSCHNWYSDMESVQRQLQTEVGRKPCTDVIAEEWFEATRIERPSLPEPTPAAPPAPASAT